MPRTYISSLKSGELVEDVFLVLKKEVRETKEKKPYLNLQLADKSGFIESRKWDATPQLCNSFNKDGFVKIKGLLKPSIISCKSGLMKSVQFLILRCRWANSSPVRKEIFLR